MKTLNIFATSEDTYTAAYSGDSEGVADNYYADSIEDALNQALSVWGLDADDVVVSFTHHYFDAQYNSDLGGFELVFNSGNVAHTQFDLNTNKLDAGFGFKFLERYEEHDSDLSDEEEGLADEFVSAFKYVTNV